MANQTVKSFCNSCARETDHEVQSKSSIPVEIPDGTSTDTIVMAVSCRGCGDWSIREELWYFENIPDPYEPNGSCVRVTYKPPRLWRRPPQWIDKLEQSQPDLKGLLDEIYSATNDSQVRLLSMGVRSALDHMMNQIVGDLGAFEKKLEAMVEKGHLTVGQKEMLETIIDAGSASTHRSYKPPIELLQEMVTVMEMVISQHFITGPYLQTARTLIPPRPPRKK